MKTNSFTSRCTSLLFVSIFVFFFSSQAHSLKAEEIEITPMVVTATRSPIAASQSAANVTVLTSGEIKRTPARNLAEALSHVPGVFIESIGGLGSQATASIYGSDARHVEVYIDGIPQNQLANPLTNLSQIPLDNIERVEIYKGAASSSWGSALGGVINIIMKNPRDKEGVGGNLDARYGENNTYGFAGNFSGRYKKNAFYLNVNKIHSDGFSPNRDYDQAQGYIKLTHDFSEKTRLDVTAMAEESEKLDPALLFSDRYESGRADRNYQTLALASSPLTGLDLKINLYRQDSYLTHTYKFDTGAELNRFKYSEEKNGLTAQAAYSKLFSDSIASTFGAGVDLRWDEYYFSTLGRDVTDNNQAFWFSEVLDVGPFSLNVGARWEDNANFGSQFSPSAGIVYRWEKIPARIRFQWSKGFSAPPLSYLYDPLYGNPALGPETGTTWQIGADTDLGRRLHLSINLFRADLEDMIYFEPSLAKVVNLDEVRRDAAEIIMKLDVGGGFSLNAGGTWVDVKNTRTDIEVNDIPNEIYDFGISHSYGGLYQTVAAKWVNYNSSQADTKDKRWIVDYLINYRFESGFEARFSVYNLTDEDEYHYSFLPRPGRWVEAGLSYNF